MIETITTPLSQRHDWLAKADVLTEALPFMRRYSGHRLVVKFGGNAMGDSASFRSFADDMALLSQIGACPVVVHGGGPQIGDMLSRLGLNSTFVDGLRVTDSETVSVVEMVLCGSVNKSLVGAMQAAGSCAVGLSGRDGGLIVARKRSSPVDLGFVGEPDAINTAVLDALISSGMTPVIAPIAASAAGETYNINADTAAGALSAALSATRLLMLTDVSGVLTKGGEHIQRLTVSDARSLIVDGTITGGMIPKVETCISAIEGGAKAAVILDGRERHAVLVELFTPHGIGTIITADEPLS